MQVTQIIDPFRFQASVPKGGNTWTIIIVLGVVSAIVYYLYWTNEIRPKNSVL